METSHCWLWWGARLQFICSFSRIISSELTFIQLLICVCMYVNTYVCMCLVPRCFELCFGLFYFLGNFLDWPTKRNLKQHAETLVKGLAVTWLTHPQLLLLPPNLFQQSAHKNSNNSRTRFRIMRKYRFSYFCRMFFGLFSFLPFQFEFFAYLYGRRFLFQQRISYSATLEISMDSIWVQEPTIFIERCGMPCDVSAFY